MKLTVLGKYGPYPKAGGACSSYLVEYDDTRILLDAGNGSLANLQKKTGIGTLDAIILSHLHSDHISDLLVMRYAVQIKKYTPIPLYLPATPQETYGLLAGDKAFKPQVLADGEMLRIGEATISFKRMTHPVESHAIKITCQDKTLVYSGDTNLNDDLAGFAAGADLLVCDTQFNNKNLFSGAPHLSAAQAAQIAAQAGVKKLLLSHINPEQDESTLLQEAKEHFPHCEIAQEMQEYSI
jgi:Metal-dependent hydrolases of the beta-lactamase superfamily III